MGWLGPDGVAPVTGARWSAGAFWADAGDPQAGDSDWEDPDDWPKAYDPDALVLGVWAGGHDLTTHVVSASWSLGQGDLWSAGLSVTSASLALRAIGSVAAGDRVVILTDADVLWSGFVESVVESEAIEETTWAVTCADDLSRAALAALSIAVGGPIVGIVPRMLAAAGVFAAASVLNQAGPHSPPLAMRTVEGDALGLVSEVAEASNAALAWSPTSGVTIYPRSYRAIGTDHEDALHPESMARTVTRDVKDVRNVFAIGSGSVVAEASVRAYGRRTLEANHGDWWAGVPRVGEYYAFARLALREPVARLSEAVRDGSKAAHRLMPLEVTIEDGKPWLLTGVSHSVGLEEWTMTADAVEVASMPTSGLLEHILSTDGLFDAWAWSAGYLWVGVNGTTFAAEGLSVGAVASIVPNEASIGAWSGFNFFEPVGSVALVRPDAIGREWSVSFWLRDDLSLTHDVLDVFGYWNHGEVSIELNTNGRLRVYVAGGADLWRSNNGVIAANTTYHVLVRHRANDTTVVQVNGATVTPAASTTFETSPKVYGLAIDSFTGALQLPAIYGVALPDGWAATHHAIGVS